MRLITIGMILTNVSCFSTCLSWNSWSNFPPGLLSWHFVSIKVVLAVPIIKAATLRTNCFSTWIKQSKQIIHLLFFKWKIKVLYLRYVERFCWFLICLSNCFALRLHSFVLTKPSSIVTYHIVPVHLHCFPFQQFCSFSFVGILDTESFLHKRHWHCSILRSSSTG